MFFHFHPFFDLDLDLAARGDIEGRRDRTVDPTSLLSSSYPSATLNFPNSWEEKKEEIGEKTRATVTLLTTQPSFLLFDNRVTLRNTLAHPRFPHKMLGN